MTETCGIISFEFPTNGKARRFGSTGALATGVEGKVVDVGTLKHLPPNQLGEICVRGPHIMKGEDLVLVPYLLRPNSHASFA
jgi:4-coumarate--CoA ligase